MQALENLIRDIAELFGLPPLAVETGLLLILAAFIIIFVFLLEAIIRIRKEMIKFSLVANYIAGLLTRGITYYNLKSGVYDFNPAEWQDDTREKVLMMLQNGKSQEEIASQLEVSESYIKGVRKWAYYEGTLFEKSEKKQ
jgi:hypothetical protein